MLQTIDMSQRNLLKDDFIVSAIIDILGNAVVFHMLMQLGFQGFLISICISLYFVFSFCMFSYY